MKTISYFLVICLIFTACKRDDPNEQEEPCRYVEYIQPLLDCMNMPRPDDSYCFPPPAYCWKIDIEECPNPEPESTYQVPTWILQEMSTQAIIQAIWEHPFLPLIVSPDRFLYQFDFESFFFNNNAYMELAQWRPDAGEALLERLVLVDAVSPRAEPRALYILISQLVFLSQLNDDAKKKIVETSLQHIDLQSDLWGIELAECVVCWLPQYTLIGRTMVSAGYAPFVEAVNDDEELKCFLDGWTLYNGHIIPYNYMFTPEYIPQTINNFSKEYLHQN